MKIHPSNAQSVLNVLKGRFRLSYARPEKMTEEQERLLIATLDFIRINRPILFVTLMDMVNGLLTRNSFVVIRNIIMMQTGMAKDTFYHDIARYLKMSIVNPQEILSYLASLLTFYLNSQDIVAFFQECSKMTQKAAKEKDTRSICFLATMEGYSKSGQFFLKRSLW